MNIIICVDNRNGMMFNNRRLSSDSILRQDILKFLEDRQLWLNVYSAKQFATEISEYQNIFINDNFIQQANDDDYCFVENPDDLINAKIGRIVIYRWNRDYPADKFFNIDISDRTLISTEEFAGSSHDKITKEVYE